MALSRLAARPRIHRPKKYDKIWLYNWMKDKITRTSLYMRKTTIFFQKSLKPNDDILVYPKISEFVTDFHNFWIWDHMGLCGICLYPKIVWLKKSKKSCSHKPSPFSDKSICGWPLFAIFLPVVFFQVFWPNNRSALRHVPFRDSRLTRILEESLGGARD